MSMFGPKDGTWWVSCKSDPRWDKDGRGCGFAICGGPSEMDKWIEQCKKEFGDVPSDATMNFMKD